mgnify:CR=1 FL=1
MSLSKLERTQLTQKLGVSFCDNETVVVVTPRETTTMSWIEYVMSKYPNLDLNLLRNINDLIKAL